MYGLTPTKRTEFDEVGFEDEGDDEFGFEDELALVYMFEFKVDVLFEDSCYTGLVVLIMLATLTLICPIFC